MQLERLAERDRAGRSDGTYTLFALLRIELWCRILSTNNLRYANRMRKPLA